MQHLLHAGASLSAHSTRHTENSQAAQNESMLLSHRLRTVLCFHICQRNPLGGPSPAAVACLWELNQVLCRPLFLQPQLLELLERYLVLQLPSLPPSSAARTGLRNAGVHPAPCCRKQRSRTCRARIAVSRRPGNVQLQLGPLRSMPAYRDWTRSSGCLLSPRGICMLVTKNRKTECPTCTSRGCRRAVAGRPLDLLDHCALSPRGICMPYFY